MLTYFYLLLLSLPVFANKEAANLHEKTFARDNTFCHVDGKRIEILVRGSSRYTEVGEKFYGEVAISKTDGGEFTALPINDEHLGLLRFLPGKKSLCSKTQGYKIGADSFAVLFSQENKPFAPKLVIQLFDRKTLHPTKAVASSYLVQNARKTKDGFKFQTLDEKDDIEMGTIEIQGSKYTYQDRGFTYWVSYTDKGFKVLPDDSYEESPWIKAFKDKEDFLKKMFWSPKDEKFDHPMVYIAVNHQTKRGCIFVSQTKIKPTGKEEWHCIAI